LEAETDLIERDFVAQIPDELTGIGDVPKIEGDDEPISPRCDAIRCSDFEVRIVCVVIPGRDHGPKARDREAGIR
jgi:hypothetical protein